MRSLATLTVIICSIFTLNACTDEKIIESPSVEAVQSCQAFFYQDIEFRYTTTYLFNGDIFVNCELTDFALNRSVSSVKFYSSEDLTLEAINLECSLFHEITPSSLAGEFVFDTINDTPGMTFLNEVGPSETNFVFQTSECTLDVF